jgi:hypothetical protein
MIRAFVQQVYVQISPFKAINPGPNHAHENRHKIMRRSVYKLLMFEPWVIEISQQVFWVFPCIIQTSWYMYIYIYTV